MGKIGDFMFSRAIDVAYAGSVVACKVSEAKIYGVKETVAKSLNKDSVKKQASNNDSAENNDIIRQEVEKIVNGYIAMLIFAAKVDGVDEEEQRLFNQKVNAYVENICSNLNVTVSSLPKASDINSFEDVKRYLDLIEDLGFLNSLWEDMGDIVNADGKITPEESKLFEDYDSYLKNRFPEYTDSHEIYQHADEAQIKEVESIFGEGV